MNRTTRRLAGGLAILAGGATLIGPIGALAQSDDDTPSTSVPATTDDAVPQKGAWLSEALAPLVDAGTLTQAQADAVTEALQAARPEGGFGGRHGGFGRGGRISLSTAATTIGISEDALRTALEGGQTLAEVATANGVQPQLVIDALVAEARTRLDTAVAEGRIEQAEADERLTSLNERITTAVNEGFPAGPAKGERRARTSDDDTATEDDSTTTTEAPTTTEGGS